MNIIVKGEKDSRELADYANEIACELELFFGFVPDLIELNVIFSRDEFNNLIGYKTPEWFVANTVDNVVCILSQAIIDRENPGRFGIILKHELVHVFISEINNKPIVWLDEGLALCLAGQTKRNWIKQGNYSFFFENNNLFKKVSYKDFCEHEGYVLSYNLVKNILDCWDNSKIIELLKVDGMKDNFFYKMVNILGLKNERDLLLILKKGLNVG